MEERSDLALNKSHTMRIIRLGVPSGITQAIFSVSMLVVQSLTNTLGEMVIACNVIVMRVDGFAMMPNMTFGNAMGVYAGQNVGAGKVKRIHNGAKQGVALPFTRFIHLSHDLSIFHTIYPSFTRFTHLSHDLSPEGSAIILKTKMTAVAQHRSGSEFHTKILKNPGFCV